ncbi:MAG: CBS domain-containing protein [Bacillota bacterium]
MIVRNVMIEDITTVSPDDTLQRAYDVIQTKHYDCLPVMDAERHLVGIIQLTDIYEACMKDGRQVGLPRKVSEVMVPNPVTISPDDLIESAAKVLFTRDIPMLPVVEDGVLKGVINESDIFRAFGEMLGVDSNTTRLTLIVPDRRGQLARIAEIIRDAGVPIRNLATFRSHVREQYQIVVRVETNSTKPLVDLLEQHGFKVIHVEVD